MRADPQVIARHAVRAPTQDRMPPASWGQGDYLYAAALAGLLIAPAPFFWAPPLWVLAMLAAE